MDMVITVCDLDAEEACPAWPGRTITAHRGIELPSSALGSKIERECASTSRRPDVA